MWQEVLEIYHLEFQTKRGKIPQNVCKLIKLIVFLKIELSARITVSDINSDMLNVGKKRAAQRGSLNDLDFAIVNAEDLS